MTLNKERGREQQNAELEHRFVTPYREVCPRHIYGPDTHARLYQKDSLDREAVIRGTFPNAIALYDTSGRLYTLEHKNDMVIVHGQGISVILGETTPTPDGSSLQKFYPNVVKHLQLRGGYIVPVSPWGNRADIMHLDLGEEVAPAVVDLPPHILRMVQAQQGNMLNRLLQDGPAYWGVNNSAGCVNGKGLMSILYVHSKTMQFDKALDGLTPDKIRAVRSAQVWDDGASKAIGAAVCNDMEDTIQRTYWRTAQVEEDAMGLTILLPGFRPDDFAKPAFMDALWRPLSWDIHEKLRRIHAAVYPSDLDETIRYVHDAHTQPFDEERYEQHFSPTHRPSDIHDPLFAAQQKLYEFEKLGISRRPPSWAGGIQFRKEGAMVAIIFGLFDRSMGPVEAMGVQLVRPKEHLHQTEKDQKNTRAKDLVLQSLRTS